MPIKKKAKVVHSDEILPKIMIFGLIGAIAIGLFVYLYSLGLLTASKAAKPQPCVKTEIDGVCYYKCTLGNGKTITTQCSAVRVINPDEKDPPLVE